MCFPRFLFLKVVKSHCGHFTLFPSPCFSLMCVVIVVRHLNFCWKTSTFNFLLCFKVALTFYILVNKYCFKKNLFLLCFEVALLSRTTAHFISVHCCVVVTNLKNNFNRNLFLEVCFLPQICLNPCSHIPNRCKGWVSSQGGPTGCAASYQSYSWTWKNWKWTLYWCTKNSPVLTTIERARKEPSIVVLSIHVQHQVPLEIGWISAHFTVECFRLEVNPVSVQL